MKNDAFDARLKSALENLEVLYDPSTWDALEKRLPVPPLSADAVDEALRPVLSRLESTGHPNHWTLLAERMVQQTRLRRRIWFSKLAEAAVFLLLLGHLDGWLNQTPQEQHVPLRSGQPIAHQPAAPTHPGIPLRGNTSSHPSATVGQSAEASASVMHTSIQPDGLETLFVASHATAANTHVPGGDTPASWSPDWLDKHLTPGAEAAPTATAPSDQPPVLLSLPLLDPANVAALAAAPLSPPPIVVTEGLAWPIKKSVQKGPFYASALAAFDRNVAQAEGVASQLSRTNGGGLAAGYRKGKWGMEVGVAYSTRRFRPRKQVEIVSGNINKGYYGVYTQEVSADVVTVPVKVTRRIGRAGRLTAHAVAGLSATVATEKAYSNKTVFYPGFQPQSGTDPQPKPTGVLPQAKGVLEGGAFKGNTYVSAVAGVRLEHPLSKRHTAFAEATYQPALTPKGIGPEASQINTISLQAGVMATL